jgi:hypothetical protein
MKGRPKTEAASLRPCKLLSEQYWVRTGYPKPTISIPFIQ